MRILILIGIFMTAGQVEAALPESDDFMAATQKMRDFASAVLADESLERGTPAFNALESGAKVAEIRAVRLLGQWQNFLSLPPAPVAKKTRSWFSWEKRDSKVVPLLSEADRVEFQREYKTYSELYTASKKVMVTSVWTAFTRHSNSLMGEADLTCHVKSKLSGKSIYNPSKKEVEPAFEAWTRVARAHALLQPAVFRRQYTQHCVAYPHLFTEERLMREVTNEPPFTNASDVESFARTVEERGAKIEEIVRGVEEIAGIFADIKFLVAEQGGHLDVIEHHINQAHRSVEGGVTALKQAEKLQSQCSCWPCW